VLPTQNFEDATKSSVDALHVAGNSSGIHFFIRIRGSILLKI